MYMLSSEVFLSIAVLGLVFYGVYYPILKWSVGTLLIIGAITIGGCLPDGALMGSNGLLMVNG